MMEAGALTVSLRITARGGGPATNVFAVVASVVLGVLCSFGSVDLGLVEHDGVGGLWLSHSEMKAPICEKAEKGVEIATRFIWCGSAAANSGDEYIVAGNSELEDLVVRRQKGEENRYRYRYRW